MTNETLRVFSGTPITPEELLVLAEFVAPSHFVSHDHLHAAAQSLADWSDHRPDVVVDAIAMASTRDERPSVLELLREAVGIAA